MVTNDRAELLSVPRREGDGPPLPIVVCAFVQPLHVELDVVGPHCEGGHESDHSKQGTGATRTR